MLQIKRALISVSDKTGLTPLAKVLERLGCEILSTGGTLSALQKAGIRATSVSDFTGQPEILGGRVKTLHPKVHGGILGVRSDQGHKKQMAEQGIQPIDLVVVNLYPFRQVTEKPNVSLEEAIENIDIGGPAMIRSAAKNHHDVAVVVDPADYPLIIQELEANKGKITDFTREKLATKAFAHTASYDAAITTFLSGRYEEPTSILPQLVFKAFQKEQDLRYGENPHQAAALYRELGVSAPLQFKQLHGKELSYNNFLDIDATLAILEEFKKPAACVVKHNNPCGVAEAATCAKAVAAAIESDPLSAFGGIVGINRPCDLATAQTVLRKLEFFEVCVAPSFEKQALTLLKGRKNVRLIEIKKNGQEREKWDYRLTRAGMLLQQQDSLIESDRDLLKKLKVATRVCPTQRQMESLLFAWKCAKLVRSNAIVLAKGTATVGIGAGQMSRVDSVKIACEKAGRKRAQGACLASDGFFPMADNIEVAHRWGVKAIIQPGGSIRDEEVIAACNRSKISMVFTGTRHFRH